MKKPKSKGEPTESYKIRLPKQMAARIRGRAEIEDRTFHSMVRILIKEAFNARANVQSSN